MARAVCRALTDAGLSDETLIGPALAAQAPGSLDLEYMSQLLRQLGGLACFDGVSVHPYQGGPPEQVLAEYARLRTLLAREGGPRGATIPIVASEWVRPQRLHVMYIEWSLRRSFGRDGE